MGMPFTSSASRSAMLVTLVASLASAVAADQSPGLVAEYFAFDKGIGDFQELKDLKPTLVRIDKQVNYEDATGPFYGTKLAENFEARWTGTVVAAKAGQYTFTTESDDGSRLFIDDKQVVDNGGPHAMGKKSGQVELSAGEHQLRLEFFQGGGGAGCKLYWTPPGAGEAVIPADALSHAKGAEAKISWDKAAWQKRGGGGGKGGVIGSGWFYDMDYGPVLCDSIQSAEPAGNLAIKGHALKLTAKVGDQTVVGGMCFDADLLRFSAGWTGAFLQLKGVAYDGAHGVPGPITAGTQIFGTPPLPGWSASESFDDPRHEPYGPLPAEQAKFKGTYINGDRAVFSYSVGTGSVLELPAFEADGKAVSRTLEIANFAGATNLVAELANGTGTVEGGIATLTAGEAKVSVGLVNAPAGVSLAVAGNRILLKIGAIKAATFKVVIANVAAADGAAVLGAAKEITAPDTLTKGGAPRYSETIETKGELGAALDAAPYVVDTVTVPPANPWKSKLRFAGFDFFSDGRAAVSTWNGDVWVVSGIDEKMDKLTWRRFATGLHQALGLKIVDDVVYVTTRDGIERLVDLNKSGEASFYENFNNDVHTSGGFHEFAFDLWTDPEGNFYYAKAGPVKPGGRGFEHITESNGCMFKISKDGLKSEVFATGFRAPNGMSVGPKGEVTSGDNEGTWTPSSRVNLIVKGGFYGVPPLAHRTPEPTDYDKPILWIPHNAPIDNSCGGQAWVLGSKWGLPEGTLLHMSYGTSSLFLVSWGKEGGMAQGGCVKFPLTFNTGIMRARFNPKDGQLYVCGLRGWQTNGANEAGFQRVRYTGKPVNMPIGYAVKKNGISLTFPNALDRAAAGAKDNYSAEEWNYLWAETYGSQEYHVDEPKKAGHDPVEITSVTLSADAKTVFLEMPKVRPVMQMKIKYKISAGDGTAIQGDYYNTVNVVGSQSGP
jgi:glucose/arabinose dehydrogenase